MTLNALTRRAQQPSCCGTSSETTSESGGNLSGTQATGQPLYGGATRASNRRLADFSRTQRRFQAPETCLVAAATCTRRSGDRVTGRPGASPAAGVTPNQRDETVSPRSRHCSPTGSVVTPHGLPTTTVDSVAVGRRRTQWIRFPLLLLHRRNSNQSHRVHRWQQKDDRSFALSFPFLPSRTPRRRWRPHRLLPLLRRRRPPGRRRPRLGTSSQAATSRSEEWAIVEAAPLPPFPIPGFLQRVR